MAILFVLTVVAEPVAAQDVDLEFARVREHFLNVYRPVVHAEAGLGLEIRFDEEVPYYFGGMKLENENLVIVIGSETHLEPGVTPDSYLALLCHEVGHRLGGPPFKTRPIDPSWSSTEGQSDYFAASVCLKKVFSADPRTELMTYMVDPIV